MDTIIRFIMFGVCGAAAGLGCVLFAIIVCSSTVELPGPQVTEAIGYGALALLGGIILGTLAGFIVAVWDYNRDR